MKRQRRLTASVTELTAFQGCRRRWYLSRLYSGKVSSPALYFGAGIHAGLEGYFKAKKANPEEPKVWVGEALTRFETWANGQVEVLKEEYGMMWEYAVNPLDQMLNLGREILRNYARYDRESEISLRPLLVERRLFIPLDEDGQIGKNGYKKAARDVLTMRWDLLAETDGGLVSVVDHKTSSGLHATGPALDLDEQGTGYMYGFWRMFKRRRIADLFIYDVLAKKVPAEPRELASGKLSKAKDQDTTLEKMLKAIQDRGLDKDDYAEVLYTLETKGWRSYFAREASPRNVKQLENYEKRARMIFADMRACIENPALAYPNPGPIRCPTCPFLQVCTSMEDGSNYQEILKTEFVRTGKTAYTLPARFSEMTG